MRWGVPGRIALVVAVAGAAIGVLGPAAMASSGGGQPFPAPNRISAQIASATARLATTLRLPHAGQPEALTHPDADHAGSPAQGAGFRPTVTPNSAAPPHGVDVASYQGTVNWAGVAAGGARFAYAKASEGTYYTNPSFDQQYGGAFDHGLIRGAYHFAIPNNSAGAAQADFFAAHGGAWSADNHTLPGMVDLEYNPYGATCYGLTRVQMVSWVTAFVNEYHADTGRWAVLYTTADWWSACTGNSAAFAGRDPLWIANYSGSPGPLPAGWATYTFWQYADHGTLPGDQDVFNGSPARLLALANNGAPTSAPAPACAGVPIVLGQLKLCL